MINREKLTEMADMGEVLLMGAMKIREEKVKICELFTGESGKATVAACIPNV